MTGAVAAEEVLAGLLRITDALDTVPPLATKIEAGVAARQARWKDVLDLVGSMPSLDPATDVSVRLCMIEALIATGRHAESAEALDCLEIEASGGQRIIADMLAASLDLSQESHRAAAGRLERLVEGLDAKLEPQARAMPVAALLGVAAVGLGEFDAAATLLGFSSGERMRLGTVLRPFEGSLEESASSTCSASLGAERFQELCLAGAAATWHDLPVDIVRS